MDDEIFRKAKQKALRLLTMREHSEHDLRKKLAEKFPEDICDEVVSQMYEYGYLDDERYAKRLCESLIRGRHYGIHRVRFELRNHGVDRDTADGVLGLYDEDDFLAGLSHLLDTKYGDDLDDPKGKKRAIDALIRRGYNYGEINNAIRQLQIDCEDDDEWTEQ